MQIVNRQMILIPFRHIDIDSPLTPAQVVGRIAPKVVVAHNPLLKLRVGKAEFIGEVREDKIRLLPVMRGTNVYFPYIPYIKGHIVPTGTGCTLQLTQLVHPVAIVFVLVFFVLPVLFGVSKSPQFSLVWLIVFLVFHFVTYFFGFLPEAKLTEARLRELAL